MEHTKECYARALIAAVENARDMTDDDARGRHLGRWGYIHEDAQRYLADGEMACTCPQMVVYLREVDDLSVMRLDIPVGNIAEFIKNRLGYELHEVDILATRKK